MKIKMIYESPKRVALLGLLAGLIFGYEVLEIRWNEGGPHYAAFVALLVQLIIANAVVAWNDSTRANEKYGYFFGASTSFAMLLCHGALVTGACVFLSSSWRYCFQMGLISAALISAPWITIFATYGVRKPGDRKKIQAQVKWQSTAS